LGPAETGEGSMTDQEVLISTLREARRIIGEYIEPGPRDAEIKHDGYRLIVQRDGARA
jgi:hypothetical protein